MKNQYFGDINDYRKYGLLRVLMRETGLKTAVCWMLTPDDGGSDGRFTEYLLDKDRWRTFDPPLFDTLHRTVVQQQDRSTRHASGTGILPEARFFKKTVPQEPGPREQYFNDLLGTFLEIDLIFFDPDNGMEVASVPYGRRGSPKYLYWHEVQQAFNKGHSLLVYQHFPRNPRDEFIKSTALRFMSETKAPEIISFSTSRIVFFLIPLKRHARILKPAALTPAGYGMDRSRSRFIDNSSSSTAISSEIFCPGVNSRC